MSLRIFCLKKIEIFFAANWKNFIIAENVLQWSPTNIVLFSHFYITWAVKILSYLSVSNFLEIQYTYVVVSHFLSSFKWKFSLIFQFPIKICILTWSPIFCFSWLISILFNSPTINFKTSIVNCPGSFSFFLLFQQYLEV